MTRFFLESSDGCYCGHNSRLFLLIVGRKLNPMTTWTEWWCTVILYHLEGALFYNIDKAVGNVQKPFLISRENGWYRILFHFSALINERQNWCYYALNRNNINSFTWTYKGAWSALKPEVDGRKKKYVSYNTWHDDKTVKTNIPHIYDAIL